MDDIIRKIKACLSRAEQTHSENESATALRQAQALMKRHGINEETLRLSEVKDAFSKASSVKTLSEWEQYLVMTICSTFGTEAVYYSLSVSDGWRKRVRFLGFGYGPELSAYAHAVLLRQLKRDREHYLKGLDKRLKRSTKTRRADLFALAWVREASKSVSKLKPTPEQMQVLEKFKEQEYGALMTAKARSHDNFRAHDLGAIAKGAEAGKNAQLRHAATGGAGAKQLNKQ